MPLYMIRRVSGSLPKSLPVNLSFSGCMSAVAVELEIVILCLFVKTCVENPIMSSALCLYRHPLSCLIFILPPLLIFTGFLGFGFLSVLTASVVVIVSSLIFTFTKQKQGFVDELEETSRSGYGQSLPHKEERTDRVAQGTQSEPIKGGEARENEVQTESGSDADKKEEDEEVVECVYRTSTSEDSEVEWIFQDNLDWSDEDSLIEIALPTGQYVGENKVPKSDRKIPGFTAESMLKQQCLVELLAEFNDMNEEDNLIEIDISMGSIKCSRFEIEA